MLRLTKFEIRKNIIGIILIFSAIAASEIYFLVSALAESKEHTAISTGVLVIVSMVAYFCVFIFGVATYSKELNSKTSYLTFMAPVSSFSIIGSKLVSTLLTGVSIAVLLVIFAMVDMALFENVFPETKLFAEFLDALTNMAGYSAAEFWALILVEVFSMLLSFFVMVSMAYLAITLSSTVFQNKKYKGIVSVAIFAGITWVVMKVGNFVPDLYDNVSNIKEVIISILPSLAYFSVIMIISLFVTAKLLDKKVSL